MVFYLPLIWGVSSEFAVDVLTAVTVLGICPYLSVFIQTGIFMPTTWL